MQPFLKITQCPERTEIGNALLNITKLTLFGKLKIYTKIQFIRFLEEGDERYPLVDIEKGLTKVDGNTDEARITLNKFYEKILGYPLIKA